MSSQLFHSAKSLSGNGPFLKWSSAAAILIVILAGPCDSRAATTDPFIRLTTYPSGGSPARTVSADFNRDGKLDVVVLNTNGVLSLLPGSGNGAFGAPQTIATLPPFSAVPLLCAGDFNGDDAPDIAVLASPGNAVEVFLGHGDGTFAAPVTISDGLSAAGEMATGDFNGDGKADIAVTSGTSIAVLLGKSVGIFANPVVTVTDLTGSGLLLSLGDVNRDSHLDAVVTDQSRLTQVLLGNGSGGFTRVPLFSNSYLVPANATAIADFNGDGNPDLVVGYPAYSQYNFALVCIYLGYGDGTFNLGGNCYTPAVFSFAEMLVTDLNGSAGLVFSGDPVMLLTNDGSGALSPSNNYAAGGSTVTLGDFNGDGRQDIVVSNDAGGGVQVLLNAGSGVLRAPLSLSRIGYPFHETASMNTTDFNYDGFADLALTEVFNGHGYLAFTGTVSLGGPRNQFNTSANVGLPFTATSNFPYSVNPPAIGDFNHDGYLDIAYSGTASGPGVGTGPGQASPETYAQILFGDGKGGFPTLGPALSLSTNFLAAGYFNGDGYADLASLDGSTFEILIGKGDGTFASPVTYAVGTNPVFVLQRDLNNDGKRDIVVVNHDSNDISILLGKGDGTFQPQKRFATGTAPLAAVTGDFNRDGKVDIAVASSAGASILLGNGDGTFQPQKTYSAGGPMTGIVQASVRQDGLECIIGIDSATQRFTLLPRIGDGTFGAPVFFPVHRVPTAIVAADFNHDGANDIVLLDDEDLVVFYNQGGDQVALASSSTAPKTGQSVTFTAHVTAGFGELGAPTGYITFKDGGGTNFGTYLGHAALQSGVAHLTTQLTAGTHQIVALYGGDSNFNSNHSATLFISVAP
jgi:Bacterial Ig-like domain (group 3)/FG-GAP-like repeat